MFAAPLCPQLPADKSNKDRKQVRILLVEDDSLLGDGIRAGLKLADYAVDWVRDGEAARLALLDHAYDACVLDLGLPRRDGLSVLKGLRDGGNILPVLILTARDTSADKIAGLDAGADDYLTKPFDLPELQARLRALIRRASGSPTPTLSYAGVVLEPASKRVTQNGQAVTLSAREYALLHDLLLNKNHIRTRSQLEESLYAWGEEAGSNTVEVYIHHLRRKFGADFIRTIRGLGYQLGDLT
jgi:DNA-binding response OmpR family regulator